MTLEQKLQAGSTPISGKIIVHTAPHHDDILLGYFPYLIRNLASNENHVLYLTSGANGVSDLFCARYHGMSIEQFHELDAATKIELKSQIRQFESEKKWELMRLKYPDAKIYTKHFRAKFYVSDQNNVDNFDSGACLAQKDLVCLVNYLKQIKPDIITVLVDEPGCGPQTHHDAAALMIAAIAEYKKWLLAQGQSDDVMILGYRNIWSSFTPEQASMIVPVSQQELDLIEAIFQQCFLSQCQNFIMQDDGKLINFGQQATEILKQQGALVDKVGLIFLQQLKI